MGEPGGRLDGDGALSTAAYPLRPGDRRAQLGEVGNGNPVKRRPGDPGGVIVPVVGTIFNGEGDAAAFPVELFPVNAGISSHSSPPMTLGLRKNGQSSQSNVKLSMASAGEI